MKKPSIIFVMLLVFISTVVCNLGSSGTSQAELKASLSTATAEAAEDVSEVVEDETIVSTPTPSPTDPPPTPTPEPTDEILGALTAQAAYDLALAEAEAWQSDAALVSIGTTLLGPLSSDGTSESWSLVFYSPSAAEMLTLSFINGKLNTSPAVQLPINPGFIPAMDSVILGLEGLYATAIEAAGDDFAGEAYYLLSGLTPYPLDESIPGWYMNFHDTQTNTLAFTVIIDARSGDVIQAIDVAGAGG